jgi:hypothetical protein
MTGGNLSDRVSDRVDTEPEDHLHRGTARGETRADSSAIHTAPDQPAPRLLRILASLTNVDLELIDLLALVRMASGSQLNRLLWPTTPSGARTARRRLQRLTDLRIVTRLHRQVGGIKGGSQGYTYALDVNGQRIAQTRHHNTIRRPTPSDSFVDHTLAVTETYITLRTTTDVELLTWEPEPTCWRSHTGPAGRSMTLRPDGYTAWAVGEWELSAFLEIDRATEHPGRIARKADQYVRYRRTGQEQQRHGVFPSVLWITPSAKRADVLRAVLGQHEAAALCTVITDDELPGFITNTLNTARKEEHP